VEQLVKRADLNRKDNNGVSVTMVDIIQLPVTTLSIYATVDLVLVTCHTLGVLIFSVGRVILKVVLYTYFP